REPGLVAERLPATEVRLEPVEVDDRRRRRDVQSHSASSSRAPVAASNTCASWTRGQSETLASRSGAVRESLRATSLTCSPPYSATQKTYESAPSSSTTSTCASIPPGARSSASGRRPSTTLPFVAGRSAGSGTSTPQNEQPFSPRATSSRFIDGEPMKPATNVFAGYS